MMNFLIMCGVHGNEQNAVLSTITAVKKMRTQYGDCKFTSDIINLPGLAENTREVPEQKPDTRDMNRMYGEKTEFHAKDMIASIKGKVHGNDIIIDVHNSPCCPNMILISNSEYAENYVRFARNYHICYAVRESSVDTVKKYAIDAGKAGITVELGGMGFGPNHLDLIDDQVNFLDNLVFHLRGCCTGTPDYFTRKRCLLPPEAMLYPLYAHKEGILRWKVGLGGLLLQGSVVAEVIDRDGKVVEEIVIGSDRPGWVVDAEETLWVTPGKAVCYVQPEISLP